MYNDFCIENDYPCCMQTACNVEEKGKEKKNGKNNKCEKLRRKAVRAREEPAPSVYL